MSVAFWETNAPWYAIWLRHNEYHRPVQSVLAGRVRPGWRVLDIGGGSGVLSSFLRDRGCRTVLLEPARAMRDLSAWDAEGGALAIGGLEPRRWEDVPISELSGFDLILACNSLHVSSLGFGAALDKIFLAHPAHICVVAEDPHASGLEARSRPGYALSLGHTQDTASSLAYHSPIEAVVHAEFRHGRSLNPKERKSVLEALVLEDGHYWLKGKAQIHLRWWTRLSQEMK